MKGFALGLALKQRRKATRIQSPIIVKELVQSLPLHGSPRLMTNGLPMPEKRTNKFSHITRAWWLYTLISLTLTLVWSIHNQEISMFQTSVYSSLTKIPLGSSVS